MIINLSPSVSEDKLEIVKKGYVLEMNGESFDFSPMNDGDTLPFGAISSKWFLGNVEKENGELTIMILYPIPENYSQDQAFPKPLVDVPDGVVEFPKGLPKVESQTFVVIEDNSETQGGIVNE